MVLENIKRAVVLSDFDGTISLHDVLDRLFSHFGDEVTGQLERDFQAGRIDDRETLTRKFERLNLTRSELESFVESEIPVDPHFGRFYRRTLREGIGFAILSGGFEDYIGVLMAREGIRLETPVFANRLDFEGRRVRPVFRHEIEECHQPFGACGNCKLLIYEDYARGSEVMVYIGDGLTDRCPAERADLVLAKRGRMLEKYCRRQGITYMPFTDFGEVYSIFFTGDDGGDEQG